MDSKSRWTGVWSFVLQKEQMVEEILEIWKVFSLNKEHEFIREKFED